MSLRFAVAALLALLTGTIGARQDTPKEFPKALQGSWVATRVEFRERIPPPEIIGRFKVLIKNDVIVFGPLFFADGEFSDKGDKQEARYKLNPQANPKAIDVILKDEVGELRMLGIYAVEGEQLRICWQLDGKARPTEFKTKAEPGQMLLVLKRSSP